MIALSLNGDICIYKYVFSCVLYRAADPGTDYVTLWCPQPDESDSEKHCLTVGSSMKCVENKT